jgi:formylglycine-generating enzyme
LVRIETIAEGPRLSVRSEVGVTNEILSVAEVGQSNWVVLSRLLVTQTPYWWEDVTNPPTSRRFYRVRLPLPVGMVLIPSGEFTMGDTFNEGSSDERPVRSVSVGGFFIDRHEVTKTLWDAVKTWSGTNGYGFDHAGSGKAPQHPVHSINWYDAAKWCNARSEREGRPAAYYTDAALTQVYRTGRVEPYVKWIAVGYRLPTEAEWEKAARGGRSAARFPWGNTISHSLANYCSRTNETYDVSATHGYHPAYGTGSTPYSSPAGTFAANDYGLHDMTGNVWEWCWDWYGNYGSTTQNDPHGPASGTKRINRGGSWYANADGCRVSDRSGLYPTNRYDTLGFRTVLPVLRP